jgi:hypothetical protein
MSRHWQPPTGKIVRIRPGNGSRLRSLDEFVKPDFVGRQARNWTRAHRSMPAGAKAGLLLIAAACVGVAIGAYEAFGPRHIIDDQVAAR